MKYRLGVADYGDFVHAWVLDLPGCLAGGPTLDEALAELPLVVAEHRAWLARHGEPTAKPEGWVVTETVDGRIDPDISFASETAVMDDRELETLVRRMRYAREDLLAAVANLPEEVLDWEPPATAFVSFDAWAPEVRSIRGLVAHVLGLEAFYRGGLRDGPATGIHERLQDAATERETTLTVLRAITPAERGRVFRPLRPGAWQPETWTLRKVARRIISHDRVHGAEVLQRWSWVLLGTPVLTPANRDQTTT